MSSRSFKGKGRRQKPALKKASLQAPASDSPRVGTVTVADAVAGRPRSDLADLFHFWKGGGSSLPRGEEKLRAEVLRAMSDPSVVEERVSSLGRRLGAVIEHIVHAPQFECRHEELLSARGLSYLSPYDLDACLTALQRRALVVEKSCSAFDDYGDRSFAIPVELGDGLLRQQRAQERGIFGVLTLRGHLDHLYSDPDRSSRTSPQRLREFYKMYSMEAAAAARIERLPEGVRGLVEKAILEFGGILPRNLFERMETDLPHWNGRRWRMLLEKSLVGTVRELELSAYGIQHHDETLVVFNEVTLAWLKRVAVPGDPDRPHEELSLGIDLISNLSRFLSYIQENDVRFTVRGEIFKTTERKILQHLIPNPGRELSREEVLTFIYEFCRHGGLIDSTGERTFALTAAGRDWGQGDLLSKLGSLLDYCQEEREPGVSSFHLTRLREIFMRLLKRVEPDTWYDLMYLPFLTRNTYLSNLDELEVEKQFADRNKGVKLSSMEDPQRLAWSLVRWVRQRLYLLGLVDLGYDKSKRPVAMRLTHLGARILGLEGSDENSGGVGNLVVTPDFEAVLFSSGDDAEVIHDLDRFAIREKQGHLLHYRLTEASVKRALLQGMSLARMLQVLDSHSRTPVPQNVRFSVRDWALRAGLMTLDAKLVLRSEDPDLLRRFLQDPGTRPYVGKQLDGESLQLKGRISPKRLRSLLIDLGYLIELV